MNWYTRNYTQITWFILGWMAMVLLTDFGKGDWSSVAFDLVVIALNYLLYKR